MYPAQNAADLIKDPIVIDVFSCSATREEPRFAIGFGRIKIGVIQFNDTGKDISLPLFPIAQRKRYNRYHTLL